MSRSGRRIAAAALAALAAGGVALGLVRPGDPRTVTWPLPRPRDVIAAAAIATAGDPADASGRPLPRTPATEAPATTEHAGQPPERPAVAEKAGERRAGDEREVSIWAQRPAPEPPGPPRIGERPDDSASNPTATFSFLASAADFYRCRLDATAPVRCTSPWSYSGLPAGAHSFAVQALNEAGPGPFAVVSWSVRP